MDMPIRDTIAAAYRYSWPRLGHYCTPFGSYNTIQIKCDAPTRHPMLGKGVTNLRTINLLTYIILNNYFENINLQKYFIYIHRSGIYSVLYIYYESHLLVLLGSHCL